MRKGFIVTYDHLDRKEVAITGPRGTTLSEKQLREGHKFRMLDDDGHVIYEGHLFGDKESEDGFLPLDCYGTPNAGCTEIQYKNKNKWETL
jgi:hypothetical protein